MRHWTLVGGVVLTLILTMGGFLTAEVPQLISFQGKLHDNAGNPLTGTYQITFRIYDVASGGTHLWTETSTVSCDNGLYNVILGLISPMTLDFDGDYWLSVQVAGDDELSPRFRIVSVPVAIRAAVADVAQQVSWNNLTDVPAGFADDTDDVGGAGGVSQINAGTGVTVTNPTGPTTTIAHAADASSLPNAHHTKTTSAAELTSGTLDNARFSAYGDLNAEGKVGTGSDQVAGGDHQHDDRYYTESELNTNDGTANEAGDPVSWNKIKDIPAGFADGVDNTGGGGSSGWVDDGSVVRLETETDNVGIGTSAPESKLHVYGDDPTLKISDTSSGPDGRGSAYLKLERGGMGKDRAQVVYSDGGTPTWHAGLLYNNGKPTPNFHISRMDYLDNGTMTYIPEFTLTTEGNVGIGTPGPTNLLELYSAAPKLYFNRGASTTNLAGLYWRSGDDNFEGAFVRNNGTGNIELYTNYSGGTPRVLITDAGAVGIGTTTPNATLDINGGLFVTGAYTGDIGPNNGAPFPRPAYDSGWEWLAQGSCTTLNHNIGGNVDYYFVDVWFRSTSGGNAINNCRYGGSQWGGGFNDFSGGYWTDLTNTQIKICRGLNDTVANYIRVRIWVIN